MRATNNTTASIRPIWLIAFMVTLGLVQPAWAGEWNLKDKAGTHYTLSSLKGKWVLVNFWAPWCPPCIREMSDLTTLQKKHDDLQIIGVAVMYGSRKEVVDVVNKQSISYPVVFGSEDTAGDFGGLVGTPTSFLYSPSGNLVERVDGAITQADIEHRIR